MQIEFAPAQPADLEEVCALVHRAVVRMREIGIRQWDEIYPSREDLSGDIARGEMRVGRTNGRIAVLYVLNREADEEYETAAWAQPDLDWRVLHRLCVHPDYQNKGLARLTLAHIERELAGLGVPALRLDVFSQNPYAQRLYERAGFTRTGTADWRMGRFYIMEKYINGGSVQ